MALEIPLFLQPSVGDPEIDYTAQQTRVMFDVMGFLAGVTRKDDLKVTQRGSGANLSVDVAAGSALIPGTSVAYQGKYLCRSTATVNVALVGGVPTSGTRTDLIVAQVYDDQADGSGQYSWSPVWVPGTTTAPANSIPLAKVTVASGISSILTAAIDGSVRLLNTLGDVPMWELSGGNGRAIPPGGSPTVYDAWNVSDSIGMAAVTTSNGVTVALPGRYAVSFSTRIDTDGASSHRQPTLARLRSGVIQEQVTNDVTSEATTGARGHAPMAVSTTFRAAAGDVIQAQLWQDSTSTLHIDDSNKETKFSGYWVGP